MGRGAEMSTSFEGTWLETNTEKRARRLGFDMTLKPPGYWELHKNGELVVSQYNGLDYIDAWLDGYCAMKEGTVSA